jgi:molybdopterin-guanine dinucleotide biosynthesis protein A
MTKRAALILAGGQAKRFQLKREEWKDKALARLFGKPLLVHVVEAIKNVVDEIIICVNEVSRKSLYSEVLREYSIYAEFCVDEKCTRVSGPLAAIATGLKAANADYCAVLSCDIPLIQPAIVDYLFNAVRGSSVAVPIWPDGRLESLLIPCERHIAAQIASALCGLGRRRPDDIIRGASRVTFVSTVGDLKKLDPEFKSFVNINFREDLTRLPTRVVEDGPIKESLHLNAGCPGARELEELKTAQEYCRRRNFADASNVFSSLSTCLESRGLNFWAAISRENEGEALLSLSSRQGEMKMRGDNRVKSKVAFKKAAENYRLETEFYEKNQVYFLAKRARVDELWLTSQFLTP